MAVIELSAVLSGKSETQALGGKRMSLGAKLEGRAGSGLGKPPPPQQPKTEPGLKD